MLRCPRGIHSFRLMTAANRRALLRSSRRLAPRPCSSALLGRESHAASLGAFQPMSPISGSFAVRALSSSSHVGESIAQGPPVMGKIHNAKREERGAARQRGERDNLWKRQTPTQDNRSQHKGEFVDSKSRRNRHVLPWAPVRLLGKEPFLCAMRPCAIPPPRGRVRLRRMRARMRPPVRWRLCRDARR